MFDSFVVYFCVLSFHFKSITLLNRYAITIKGMRTKIEKVLEVLRHSELFFFLMKLTNS